MKKTLILSLIILALFSGSVVAKSKSYSKTVTKVDDLEVRVESDQPGRVIVENHNSEVTIKTSQGITPTIYISDKKITPTIVTLSPRAPKEQTDFEVNEQSDKKQPEKIKIFSWLKNLVTSIFNFLLKK